MQHNLRPPQTFHLLRLDVQRLDHVEFRLVLLLDGEGRHRRHHNNHLLAQTGMPHSQEPERSRETDRMKRPRKPRLMLCGASIL